MFSDEERKVRTEVTYRLGVDVYQQNEQFQSTFSHRHIDRHLCELKIFIFGQLCLLKPSLKIF